jgi:hypothetical protein
MFLRALALYLTSVSRFASDFNSARRHHLFYELSPVTTFLAVERHINIFGISCVAVLMFTVTWLMLRIKFFLAICPHQVIFSIEQLRHMIKINIFSFNSNKT